MSTILAASAPASSRWLVSPACRILDHADQIFRLSVLATDGDPA